MSTAMPPTAPRYVVRTVDEDGIDLFDAPARVDAKRAAWDEAQRRVRAHPECTTLVIERRTGATLWQSDPDLPPRFEVVAIDAAALHAMQTDPSRTGDVLSTHKAKDDAWTAFYEAIAEPHEHVIVLHDTMSTPSLLASSDEDRYRAQDA